MIDLIKISQKEKGDIIMNDTSFEMITYEYLLWSYGYHFLYHFYIAP